MAGEGKRCRGQTTLSAARLLRVDARRPLLTVRYKRKKRVVTLSAGLKDVVVSWGDRTRDARGRSRLRATHGYRRRGVYPLTSTARDATGNETVSTRIVRIR